MNNSSLAYTTWNCKYHIVYASKYRRKVIYKRIRDIIHIFKERCKRKGIEIIAGKYCPDRVHTLISIPPKYSVSEVMGYLKGKSLLMIFERMQISSINTATGISGLMDICRYCRENAKKSRNTSGINS